MVSGSGKTGRNWTERRGRKSTVSEARWEEGLCRAGGQTNRVLQGSRAMTQCLAWGEGAGPGKLQGIALC